VPGVHSTAAPPQVQRSGCGEIRFPEVEGRRSTTATCRAILADAARAADEELGARIESAPRWRSEYLAFLPELTALAAEPSRALAIARAGLASMRSRLVLEQAGRELPLGDGLGARGGASPSGSGEITGSAAPAQRLEVPYRGRMLHGAGLSEQLERWAREGTVEPSFARAVALVAEHPEWLSLPGRSAVLVGAGAEIGPLRPLLAWGAEVLAVDLPLPQVWARIGEAARRGAGTLRMPLGADGSPGLDVVADPAGARDWIEASVSGPAVLGMYGYADGGAHVLLTAAFDAIAGAQAHDARALAYLATPTDAYLVPAPTAERARAAYRGRRLRAVAQAPLKTLSRGRLYRPAYTGGEPVADALVAQQGPNYALAKRLQRWRGLQAIADGERVSFNVAPATWTRSVTKNRVLGAAYAGAGHFGIEIFEPATTRTLMAAMLVHDLHAPQEPPADESLFSGGAAHGGLWTAAYEPRSALGVAALAGLPSTLLGGGRRGEPKEAPA
jgi:hypothetical protein